MEQNLLEDVTIEERQRLGKGHAHGVVACVRQLLDSLVPIIFRLAGELASEPPTTKCLASRARVVESNDDLLGMLGNAKTELETLPEEVIDVSDVLSINGHVNGFAGKKRVDRPDDEDDEKTWATNGFARYALSPNLLAVFIIVFSSSSKRQRVEPTSSAFVVPATPERPTTNGYGTSHEIPKSTTPSPSTSMVSIADSEGRPAVTVAMLRALTQNVKRKYGGTPTPSPMGTPTRR
jgi:hypothetical protein